MIYRILYVEDEQILGQLVTGLLQKEGYEVKHVTSGDGTLQAYRSFKPHLCLLDVMLPGKDGFEIAEQIRKIDSQVPILFLTAKVQAADVVRGFKAGCNDYIRKPFNSEELLMRVNNWLNEKYGHSSMETADECVIGDLLFYPRQQILKGVSGEVALTHKESLLLQLLYTHRNNIVSREHLLQKVWGSETSYSSRTLDVYINRLRKYLDGTPNLIVTLKGIGYRFIC